MNNDVVCLDIADIVSRLLTLRSYDPELAEKMEHEEELPEDPAPFLVDRIEYCYAECEKANELERDEKYAELAHWLILSYRYYLMRLARRGVWTFTFPSSDQETKH